MVTCQACGKEFKSISVTHLRKKHGIQNINDYYMMYPDAEKNPNFFLGNTKKEEKKEYSPPKVTESVDPLTQACLDSWGYDR